MRNLNTLKSALKSQLGFTVSEVLERTGHKFNMESLKVKGVDKKGKTVTKLVFAENDFDTDMLTLSFL